MPWTQWPGVPAGVAPPQAAAIPSLSYLLYDLATGSYIGRLPFAGASFGSQLLQPGQFSGTIDLASTPVQDMAPLAATQPGRTMLAVDYNGVLVWAGIVWTRERDFDGTSRKLSVTATEMWSYFQQRIQATDYSSPPFSGLTGTTTPMAIWNAASNSNTWDPVLIAWQLISDALTQVNYGNILGGLSIAANGYTTASDYLASGTNTPTSDYLSVNYPLVSLQVLHQIVSMLASNGLFVGFDYAVDVQYSGGPGSSPVGTVNLSYPRRGRTYANNNLVMNCGQAVSYKVPEDATQTANTIYEQGSNSSLVVSQNINPLQGGYPLLEQLASRANVQSANVMSVLSTLGIADLVVKSYPVATPTVTFDLFSGPVPLGEFTVGDDVRWIIPATDGAGNVWDPGFPNGLDQEWRIVGYTATVNDAGQSTITFNLATPPATSVGGPAV